MCSTEIDFIKKINQTIGYEYILMGEFKSLNELVRVKHICGYETEILPKDLLSKKYRCKCFSQSKGASFIEHFLLSKHINFKTEYTNPNCRNIYKLRFDFGILDNSNNLILLIEFDGKQHEKINQSGQEGLAIRKVRDNKKNKFCEVYNIPLERISYKDMNSIGKVLSLICDKYNLLNIIDEKCTERLELFIFENTEEHVLQKTDIKSSTKLRNKLIQGILDYYDVTVIQSFKFADCINKSQLIFSFALIKNDEILFVLEMLPIHHFELIFNMDSLQSTILNDYIKTDYCKNNNIVLEKIPYWEFENLENKLVALLKKYNIEYIN